MNDGYAMDTPNLGEPANNLVLLTQDDEADLPVGVKALRIFNGNAAVADVVVETVAGNTVTIKVPASALVIEPLRIKKLLEATTDGVIVHGYTDFAVA